uniref:Protein kinase domain-containing protein n=1 Tax=Plectus sambesii TaxID=2011161 RepID=A0A914XPB1_9BILA
MLVSAVLALCLSALFVYGNVIKTAPDCFEVACDHPASDEDQSFVLDQLLGSRSCQECQEQGYRSVPLHDAKVDAVKIRRETIASEEEVSFWYAVNLTRPRQVKMKHEMESFVNLTTTIRSPPHTVNLADEEEDNSPVAFDRVPVDHSHDHGARSEEHSDNHEIAVSTTEAVHESHPTSSQIQGEQNHDNISTTQSDNHTTESTATAISPSNTTTDNHEGNETTTGLHYYNLVTTSFLDEEEINRAENDALMTMKLIIALLLLTAILALTLVLTYHWRMRLCPCLPARYKYSPANYSTSGYRYETGNEELANAIPLSGYNRPLLLDDGLPEMQEYRDLLAMCPMFLPVKLELRNGVGEGRYGIIYKGTLLTKDMHPEETTVHCAKSPFRMRIEDARIFLETLSPTARAGCHQNIVSLMGICDQDERLLICMEPLIHADLQTVLREGRTMKGEMGSPSGQTYHQTASLMSMQRLLRLMMDCALGAAHLESRGVIHPHLAACNVLVGERGTAKISGFGFATHRCLYRREHEPRLSSIRWQAPETLAGDEYGIHSQTTKSQVWSLGVLLWEICSLGSTPYADIESSVQFLVSMQTENIKLRKPNYVGDEL